MNNKLPLPLLVLLVMSVFITAPYAAEVYKSVDESGNTTYSDTPGSDQAESLKLDSAPSQDETTRAQQEVEQLNRKVEKMGAERRKQKAEKAQAKADKQYQRAACESARSKLQELESVPPNRRLIVDPDGTSRRVSWEEMQEVMQQARQQVEQACK